MTTYCAPDPQAAVAVRLTAALEAAGRLPDSGVDMRTADAVARAAADVVGAAVAITAWATHGSITMQAGQKAPMTLASTAPDAEALDSCQYATRSGPCLDALGRSPGAPVWVPDLRIDPRWPQLGAAVAASARSGGNEPVWSVLSCPITAPDGQRISLNLYREHSLYLENTAADATPPEDLERSARLAGAVVGVGVSALLLRRKADNLAVALESNRQIGAALGILISRRQWSYDHAFDQLKAASQNSNRKLRDLADEVILTGTLPAVPARPAVA